MRAPTVIHACTVVAVVAAAAACGAADPAAPAAAPATTATSVPAPTTVAAATPPTATAARPAAPASAPVAIRRDPQFGRVLVTRDRRALYTWAPERADRRVHCTGGCAALWPPLVVARGTRVAARVAGVRGRFGTIRRPDGTVQVTLDGVPVYTYVHEGPGEVRCDDVDGWFVVRLR